MITQNILPATVAFNPSRIQGAKTLTEEQVYKPEITWARIGPVDFVGLCVTVDDDRYFLSADHQEEYQTVYVGKYKNYGIPRPMRPEQMRVWVNEAIHISRRTPGDNFRELIFTDKKIPPELRKILEEKVTKAYSRLHAEGKLVFIREPIRPPKGYDLVPYASEPYVH